MHTDLLAEAQRLSDGELTTRVSTLARQERAATVALIAHLAVFDARRLYVGEGCTSVFAYCTEVLHLAEHAAYNRIEAARAARDHPILLDMLTAGDLTLATARLLAPHLTPEACGTLLTAARGKSKREVEELVADLRPKPVVPPSIRKVPLQRPGPASAEEASARPVAAHAAAAGTAPVESLNGRRPAVDPLGGRQFRVQFTASAQTRDKLRLAQDLLRHQIPDGDVGQIVDRALTLLLESLAREKFAATGRPRRPPPPADSATAGTSRHIPAAVRREVWLRDGARCAFVSGGGRRCGARGFLEFHHVIPFRDGGPSTSANIELRCRAHNTYEAVLYLGRGRLLGEPGGGPVEDDAVPADGDRGLPQARAGPS